VFNVPETEPVDAVFDPGDIDFRLGPEFITELLDLGKAVESRFLEREFDLGSKTGRVDQAHQQIHADQGAGHGEQYDQGADERLFHLFSRARELMILFEAGPKCNFLGGGRASVATGRELLTGDRSWAA
jgi:hypothetical protein